MAVQAHRGLALRPAPAEVTAHELVRAKKILMAKTPEAAPADGASQPAWGAFAGKPATKADRTAAREALSKLLAASAEHGSVTPQEVDLLAAKMQHGAQKALREIFDAVQTLKQEGRFVNVRRAHALSPEIMARLDAGRLTPSELKHVEKLARFELLETFADPVRDDAFRAEVATELKKKFHVRNRDLEPYEIPAEMTLRETNERASRALRVLLADRDLPESLQLACIRRLGRNGDLDALPVLEKLAHSGETAELQKAAKAAMTAIKKAAKMTIVFAAMEAKPYCGTGGLSNVMAELPKALAKMGHKVIVLVPRHEGIDADKLQDTGKTGVVYGGDNAESFKLLKHKDAGVDYVFIENDRFFSKGRDGIYGNKNGDYGDNAERYDFFGAAIPVALRSILGNHAPDVVQLNDAHTGAAAAYLKRDPAFAKTKTIMAVHNLGGAYQGKFDDHHLSRMRFNGLGLFHPGGPAEFYGQINLMKLGLVESDGAITVSRDYMREVLTDQLGEGLHGVMRMLSIKDRLWGNLNGIDNNVWNPETDRYMKAHFSIDDLSGKATCKADVQARFGLAQDPDAALVGVVARLTNQKGFDDILQTIERTMESGKRVQFAVTGQGDAAIADQLRDLERRYPGKVAFDPNFNVEKEHLVYSASDFFLMPSKFEPCGLPQMYALRYMTVPIVRAVGGLNESISNFDEKSGTGNGFKFKDDLQACMDRALAWYAQGPEARHKLLSNCAASDFSWENSSAPEQLAFFRKIINRGLSDES